MFFVLVLCTTPIDCGTRVVDIATRNKLYVYENANYPDDSINFNNYYPNIEEDINYLKDACGKIVLGSYNNTHFVISRHKLGKNNIKYKPTIINANIHDFTNAIYIVSIMGIFYALLCGYLRYIQTFHNYKVSKTQVGILNRLTYRLFRKYDHHYSFKIDEYSFEYPTIQRGIKNMSDFTTEVLATLPLSKNIAIVIYLILPNVDVEVLQPVPIQPGELEADDAMDRIKVPVSLFNQYNISLKLPGSEIRLTAPNICYPKSFVSHRCYDYIIMNLILNISRLERNLPAIISLIHEISFKLDFDGFGFFSKDNSSYETIEFISSDPDMRFIALDTLPKLKNIKLTQNGIKLHAKNVEMMGYHYEIGRSSYYFICMLKNKKFQIVENGFSIVCSYIAIIFHIYITNSEDSLTIQRFDSLIRDNTNITYLEFIGNSKDSTQFLNEMRGKNIELTDELLHKMPQISTEEVVQLENGCYYQIKTEVIFDDAINKWVRSVLIEDCTEKKKVTDECKDTMFNYAVASKYYNFHQMVDETTMADDSLAIELGYHNGSCNLLDFVNPDEIPYMEDIKTKPLIFHLITANGGTKWYTSFPYTDPSSPYTSLVFAVYDLSVLQGLNHNVLQSTVLAAAEDYFALYLIDTTSMEVLDAISHSRFSAKTWTNILENCDPAYRNSLNQCFMTVKNSTIDHNKFIGKHAVLRGGYDWCDYNFDRTTSRTVLVTLRRVSEEVNSHDKLLQTKNMFTLALYHSNVICWTFDNDSNEDLILINRPQNFESVRLNWNTILHNFSSDCIDTVKEKFETALKTGQKFELEVSLIFDKMRWILFRGTRCGKNQLCGVYFDLTELRENEILLEMKRKQIYDAMSAKTIFLANMSHEIRTPLNGMFSLLELLMATQLSPDQLEMMTIVKSSFTKLLDVLNDTLDLAKIDQGKMTPSRIVFSPLEIIEQISSDMAKVAKKGVELSIDCPASFPILCFGDPHFMMRIVYNLMTNAAKFTSKGNITVRVDHESSSIRVEVIDTGIGIPENDKVLIFDAFTQIDSSSMRAYGGSGIGLTLVQRLVSLLQGQVWVDSTVGIGSTFVVMLPYQTVYSPYFPRRWHEMPAELLILDTTIEKEVTFLEMSDFYGYKLVHRKESATNNLKFIIIDNSQEQIDEAKETQKMFPSAQVIMCKSRSKEGVPHPEDYYIANYPKKPTVIRRMLILGKFGQKVIEKTIPPNVLVADDNDVNRSVIDKILAKIEIPHTIVCDGSEIMDALRKEHYDVILLDQYMPIMSGPDACRAVRESGEDFASIPIIAMTASSTDEDKNECLSSGMNDFVTKPITIAKLHKLLKKFYN